LKDDSWHIVIVDEKRIDVRAVELFCVALARHLTPDDSARLLRFVIDLLASFTRLLSLLLSTSQGKAQKAVRCCHQHRRCRRLYADFDNDNDGLHSMSSPARTRYQAELMMLYVQANGTQPHHHHHNNNNNNNNNNNDKSTAKAAAAAAAATLGAVSLRMHHSISISKDSYLTTSREVERRKWRQRRRRQTERHRSGK
jgi:hypothetical protein